MSRFILLSLQILVAVVTLALWQFFATVEVFGKVLLPPFFFSTPLDVASQVVNWFWTGTIWKHLVITLWGTDPQRLAAPLKNADIKVASLVIGIPHLASLGLAIALVALLSLLLKRTRIGRALRGIAENPDAATLMGIEVNRIVPVVFVITGVLSGLAGILYGMSYSTVTPHMGDTIASDAIAGMVLGGLGNVWGAIVGGLLVGLVKVLAIAQFGAEIEKIPVWGLLLLVLIVRPTGLFGHTKIGKGKF